MTKTKLEPGEDAPKLAAYLKARAADVPRAQAARPAGLIDKSQTTLIGVEWNALTYAGVTVWNVHNETKDGGGYVAGKKRRPRSEWVIQEGTHSALISRQEAEAILVRLEARASKRSLRTAHLYLLAGILQDSSGRKWQGDSGKFYALQCWGARRSVYPEPPSNRPSSTGWCPTWAHRSW